jgi:hypothetical protein
MLEYCCERRLSILTYLIHSPQDAFTYYKELYITITITITADSETVLAVPSDCICGDLFMDVALSCKISYTGALSDNTKINILRKA